MAEQDDSVPVEFRNIIDFPGYQIGDDGTYRSQHPSPGRVRLHGDNWYVMRGHDNGNGYLVANLYRDGKRHVRYIHRLVLEAFVGPCPPGMEACHDPDRDRANCRRDNLRWDTRKNNHADKNTHGTMLRGERVYGAVLTAEDVCAIRELHKDGHRYKEIADIYGIHRNNVASIVKRNTWKHVQAMSLARAGRIIESRRDGKNNIYRLTDLGQKLAKFLDDLDA